MSRLVFFYSAMNAGKSTLLLQKNYNCISNNIPTLLFIPFIVNNNGFIESRLKISEKAIIIKNDFNLFNYVNKLFFIPKIVFVDEVQFLNKKHIFELIAIVDILKIDVYTYGLRTDFRGKLFNGSKYLLALADKLVEVKTACFCGKKAIMNVMVDNKKKKLSGSQICLDKKKYISCCRFHYYNF